MKKLVLAALVALFASVSLYAKDFEGKLELSIEAPGSSATAIMFIKGTLLKVVSKEAVKMENGVEGYPVIDFEKKKITLISPKGKYYMDMPLSQLENSIAKQSVKPSKSGLSDVILGLQAEAWILDEASSQVEAEVWATKDLRVGFNILVSLQKTYPEYGLLLGRIGKALADQGCFPLKATVKDKKGTQRLAWSVLGFEEALLADSEFAIPEGYGKMSDMLKKAKKSGGR